MSFMSATLAEQMSVSSSTWSSISAMLAEVSSS